MPASQRHSFVWIKTMVRHGLRANPLLMARHIADTGQLPPDRAHFATQASSGVGYWSSLTTALATGCSPCLLGASKAEFPREDCHTFLSVPIDFPQPTHLTKLPTLQASWCHSVVRIGRIFDWLAGISAPTLMKANSRRMCLRPLHFCRRGSQVINLVVCRSQAMTTPAGPGTPGETRTPAPGSGGRRSIH